MTDMDAVREIQSSLGTTSHIQLFRYKTTIMYGIKDDRTILLELQDGWLAKQFKWNLEKPHKDWQGCEFEGTTLVGLDLHGRDFEDEDKLTELPVGLNQLTSLQAFSCSANAITSLPSELGQLTNLRVLCCSNNELTELPMELGNLHNLQKLFCANNELTELPTELGNLGNLQFLYCFINHLTELPTELGELHNLQQLCCQFNPWLTRVMPPEIQALKTQHGCEVKY